MDNDFLNKDEVSKKTTIKKRKRTRKNTRNKKTSSFIQILNGDFLTKGFMLKNLSFIFFIMLLLLIVVGKGYYGKQLSNDVINTQKELNELTSDYFESKAILEEKTKRSELIKKLTKIGLKETVNPTKVIKIHKEKREIEQ
ncbi:MAG: hypothetical protein CL844_08475 [Crocinitomicaceae bacterium]|nr:hypothetical protein [Crocinitomicaceae bacterium]|tara:strand:- start:20782 stop:21204 length:423 start_codon:yes stop_codon:yes gene_type:complete